MDPLTIAAAGGLRSRMESLDMLANNLANAGTGGYKTDREFYNLFVSPDAVDTDGVDPTTLPVIEANWTDFSQGAIEVTSNQLDFALDGKGFFAIDGPSGTLYTRSGNFRLSPDGTLATADGYAVRGTDGKPVKLNSALAVEVAADGTITQSGQTAGRLAIVDFEDPRVLAKQGNTYFRVAEAAAANAKTRPSAAMVMQGKIEGSNVGSAESAVRLVNVMRQFEMLQRAITIGGEMNKKAVEEVARVTS